jgi:hypothetical protein
LPDDLRNRYDELIARRDAEAHTPAEHQNLLRLTEDVERIEGDRLGALAELARVRGLPLRALMQDLGIPTSSTG